MGTRPPSLCILARVRKSLLSMIRIGLYSDMGTYPAFLDKLDMSYLHIDFTMLELYNMCTYRCLRH